MGVDELGVDGGTQHRRGDRPHLGDRTSGEAPAPSLLEDEADVAWPHRREFHRADDRLDVVTHDPEVVAMEGLIPAADVPELLGVTETTLARWRVEGRGPKAYKVGRNVRYRPSDVTEWLEARALPRGAA